MIIRDRMLILWGYRHIAKNPWGVQKGSVVGRESEK
jgi:hypothetical protein